jgi:hypothetical protein
VHRDGATSVHGFNHAGVFETPSKRDGYVLGRAHAVEPGRSERRVPLISGRCSADGMAPATLGSCAENHRARAPNVRVEGGFGVPEASPIMTPSLLAASPLARTCRIRSEAGSVAAESGADDLRYVSSASCAHTTRPSVRAIPQLWASSSTMVSP